MTQSDGFRFKDTVQVRFGDVDMMGHVNNTSYFVYMEQGRILYFDEVIGYKREDSRWAMILAEATCSYKRPLFYRDVVEVWVRVSRLGNKSFTQEYQLIRQSDGALVATGNSVSVAYNYEDEQSIALPQQWRDNIASFEPALKE